jgi:pimeloyl-ACP methyl ester carboxylesterase
MGKRKAIKKLVISCTLFLVVVASPLTGWNETEELAYQSHFEPAECQFEIPSSQTVDCGYLTVPEDRSRPGGPTIRLYVAIFRSPSKNPALDPVVYLAGGPGEHAIETLLLSFNHFAPFLTNRDLIVFDQRGTGYSEPALDCPELTDLAYEIFNQNLSSEEIAALRTEAICSCHDRLLNEGINLAAYNNVENAADLNDLRIALGYKKWNLYGVSYGAQLALTAMRDYPEGIRSVILDSSYPPQVSLYAKALANCERAFNVFFADCVANPVCSKVYPELETVFYDLVDQLSATPVTIQVTHPFAGKTYDMLINGDDLISFLYHSLQSTEVIPLLPEIIFNIRDGNYDTLASLFASFLASKEYISTGMYLSVLCSEEMPFTTPEELATACEEYPKLQGLLHHICDPDEGICTICEIWDTSETDPIENEPVNSNIPTLVLSGEYDPVTPPAWGKLIAETLDNSFYYELPGAGHGVISGGACPFSITLAFLNDPTTEPDRSYIAEMSSPGSNMAESLSKLVAFCYAQGKYAKAEPLCERALAIDEKALGPDHPDVATLLSNLALLLKIQGKYAEAEPLFKQALAVREKAFGPDHPDVVVVLENMTDLYREMDKRDEAQKYQERVNQIRPRQ